MDFEQLKVNKRSDDSSDFFDTTYTRVYKNLLNLELREQLHFLKEYFVKKDTDVGLDLCCGSGRHLIPLNNSGYKVDGVDINEGYVMNARNIAKEKNLDVTVYQADVQKFKKAKLEYNLVYSIESSIGYLPDMATLNIFRNVNQLMHEKGIFILHLINKEHLISRLTTRMWFGNSKNGYVLEERTLNLDQGTINLDQVRIIDGKGKHYSINMRLYTLQEIELLLDLAGMKVVNTYGDFKKNSFNIHTPYMIVEAIKK